MNSCPLDICCFIYRFGNLIDELIFFLSRVIAGFWQDWLPRSTFIGTFLIPVGFTDAFFCDEYGPMSPLFSFNPIQNPNAVYGQPTAGCLKFEPVIVALDNLLTGCLCKQFGNGIANVLDTFLRWFTSFVTGDFSNPFPIRVIWPNCFCNGGPDNNGIIPPFITVITVLVRQISILIRNINNPNYWAPQDGGFSLVSGTNQAGASARPPIGDSITEFRKSWINRLLAPLADALCQFITNSGCLLTMLLGDQCGTGGLQNGDSSQSRWQLLSSLTRYLLEALIRLIALIEAFAKIIGLQLPGQCVGDPSDISGDQDDGICRPPGPGETLNYGSVVGGINSQTLGDILVSLLTFIVDALIGIGRLGCTELCNTDAEFTTQLGDIGFDPLDPCACWNFSPYYSPRLGKCDITTGIGAFYNSFTQLCDVVTNLTNPLTGENPGFERSRPGGCGWASGDPRYCVDPDFMGGLSSSVAISECGLDPSLVPEGGYPFIPVPGAFNQKSNPFRTYRLCYLPSTGDPTCDQKLRDAADRLLPLYNKNENVVPACYRIVPDSHKNEPLSAILPDTTIGNTQLKTCVDMGMCKNDQNVRCTNFGLGSRGFVLDGMIRAALIYLKCLLTNIFQIPLSLAVGAAAGAGAGLALGAGAGGIKVAAAIGAAGGNVGGPNLAVVVDPLLFILSILWQLSAGIIKFVVAIVLLLLNFITKNPFVAFFTALGDVFGLLNTFIGIFTQPLILVSKRNAKEPKYNIFDGTHKSNAQQERELLEVAWDYVFGGAENVTEALQSDQMLIQCFCKYLDLNPDCYFNMNTSTVVPGGLTTTDVLMYVAGRFTGTSVCDKLAQSCSGMSWADVPEPEKYTYLQCVAGKVKGQRVKQMLGSTTFPDDFFISETGWIKYFKNIAHQAKRYVNEEHREHETRYDKMYRQTTEDWNDSFQLLPQEYEKKVKAHIVMAKNVLVQDGSMRKDSPVLEPVAQLSAVWFKYNTGYYHFLGRRAWNNYQSGRYRLLPTYKQTFELMKDGLLDIHSNLNQTQEHLSNLVTSVTQTTRVSGIFIREIWQNGLNNIKWPQPELPKEKAIHPMDFVRQMPIVKQWRESKTEIPAKHMANRVFERATRMYSHMSHEWDKIKDRLTTLSWNRAQWDWTNYEDSTERVKRVLFKPFYWVWPQYVDDDMYQRFVISGDGCKIVDGAVNQAAELVDYCVNSYMFNVPERHKSRLGHVDAYLNYSATNRRNTYLYRHQHQVVWQKSPTSTNDTDAYRRARLLHTHAHVDRFRDVDPRIKQRVLYHERAATSPGGGLITPGNSQTLYDRVICLIENVFNIDVTGSISDWFERFTEWVENPNTGYDMYPDVGLQFWVNRCCSTSCV